MLLVSVAALVIVVLAKMDRSSSTVQQRLLLRLLQVQALVAVLQGTVLVKVEKLFCVAQRM